MKKTPNPTCFVISPIGPDDSDVRKDANDFLELLVQPALQKFGFEVIRADKIARPTVITTDIIRHVQEAELCIIDVSGNNPNVFYECGRRHETGLPFIQMVSKTAEGDLPFDVAGIRTLTYDLGDPRAVLESQGLLQDFVSQVIEAGFNSSTSGESLTSLAQGIERIDRKINRLLEGASTMAPQTAKSFGSIEFGMKPPKQAWREAIEQGRLDLAYKALPRIKLASSYSEYVAAVGVMASFGEDQALAMIEHELDNIIDGKVDDADDELITTIAQVLMNHATNTGSVDAGIERLDKLLDDLGPNRSISNETRGFIANKMGMMAWQKEDIDRCIQFTQRAIDFYPEEPAYLYNLALAYEHIDAADELESTLKRLQATNGLDSDHEDLLRRNGYTYER